MKGLGMYSKELKYCPGCRNACSIDDLSCPMGRVFLEEHKANLAREEAERASREMKELKPRANSQAISRIKANMLKTKVYVCPFCGKAVCATDEIIVRCCSRTLEPLVPEADDGKHGIRAEFSEGECCLKIKQPDNDCSIKFVAVMSDSSVNLIKITEETSDIAFKLYGGEKIFYYCSQHGLLEISAEEN